MAVSNGPYGDNPTAEATNADDAYQVDTHIAGNPDQCRSTGQALQQQAQRVGDAGATINRVQGESGESWIGKAGNAFYDHLQKWLPVGPTTETAMLTVAGALMTFGDDIHTAQATMQHAITAAQQGGLEFDGRYIKMPLDAPPNPLDDNSSPQQIQEHNQQAADHARKQQAWNEVCQTNITARGQEQAAKGKANAALDKAHFDLQGAEQSVGTAITRVLSFSGSVNSTTAAFADTAKAQRGLVAIAITTAQKNPKLVTTDQIGEIMQAARQAGMGQYKSNLWNKYARLFPKSLRDASALSPGQLSGLKKVPFLRRLGVVGTLFSAVSTERAVHYGADAGKEWTKFGVDAGEGLAISEGVAAFIPGPGWAYIVGATAAIPVTDATNQIIDHWGDGTSKDAITIQEDYMNRPHLTSPY